MAEPINLRQARKAKARRDKDVAASLARALSAETKTTRAQRKNAERRARAAHDGHKRDSEDKV